jgi:hypothetical protein
MFKFRNLLAIGIAVVMLVIVTTPWASARPLQQATATPEATTLPTDTPAPTIAATDTPAPTIAASDTVTPVAPAVSPLATPGATPVGTPSTLPATGGSDDGAAALSLLLMATGAVILAGLAGLAASRRSR